MAKSAPINQKEYLKRYLAGGGKDGKKKKRKKAKLPTGRGLNIVDDNLEHITIDDEDETDLYELAENAPQVAGVYDDRPIHIQQAQDKLFGAKWKSLAVDQEESQTTTREENDIPVRSRPEEDSDCSPPRGGKRRDSNDDVSPPRKNTTRDATSKKHRQEKSDDSLQRRQDRSKSPKNENRDSRHKERNTRRRKDSSSDDSPPPRKKQAGSDSDISPSRPKSSRRSRSGSPSRRDRGRKDASPPTRHKALPSKGSVRGDKPSRRSRWSPLPSTSRERERRSRTPTRKEKSKSHSRRRGSDSDARGRNASKSPDRRRSRKDSDSDISPPRHKIDRRPSDRERKRTPPRKSKTSLPSRRGSDSDISPPRNPQSSGSIKKNASSRTKPQDSDSDLSPPRLKIEPLSPTSSSQSVRMLSMKVKQEPGVDSAPKTLEGKKAGLQDARTLKAEMEILRKQEQEQFKNMADQVSGRGAKAVVRDRKTGRKRDLEQEEKQTEEEKEVERKRKAEFDRIGRGVVQEERRAQALEETMHEMSKPVARYAGDEDLERHLKAQEREGDPMLDYLRAKRLKENPDLGKPAYKGPDGPSNRFNILPGHRWDGVDRSNGYEKKLFVTRNAREAQREESYKWSVQDM